jgi:hypothetical protein
MRRPRLWTAPLVALSMALAVPAIARADCPAQPLDRTFLPWLDGAWYEAAPNGGLESGADGWTLNGATVVNGNDPYEPGSQSLSIPSGASALTPPMCVDLAHPTLRFFARGGLLLTVTVLFDGLELPVGVVTGGSSWQPSLPMLVAGNLLSGEVQFRFTALGNWRVDDVFVDPYSKG